jgi:electron transport complex protein RnfG
MQPNQGGLKKFYPILLLTLVILTSVVLLSFTNSYYGPMVDKQIQDQQKALLQTMFPEMTDYAYAQDSQIYTIKQSGNTIGYAFIANGKGYGGTIQILVGLQDAKTVKGISIVAQTETNGMGSRVTLPKFTDQFVGKAIANVQYSGKSLSDTKSEQIDGWSGSTISSKAVINAVRETALLKAAQLPK